MTNKPFVEIFTDGSCLSNPGPGGWAAILRYKGTDKKICGGVPQTTNNIMELTAVIQALSALKKPCRVKLVSDSQYVVKGGNSWLKNWKSDGRLYSGGIKNPEQWQAIDSLMQIHDIEFVWVKGHSGMPENEECDRMATEQARQAMHSAR